MLTFVSGNLFESPAQVLTNTINCVGVMGKGLALEFKTRYPEMFTDYKRRCDQGHVQIGKPYLWENDSVQILNFPTKRHWKNPSRIEDIEKGLAYLAKHYSEMGIITLAMSALGCGHGGLDWTEVKQLLERYMGELPDLGVSIYQPKTVVSEIADEFVAGTAPDSTPVVKQVAQPHEP